MSAGITRIATEDAVSAIVTTEVGQGDEDLPRVGDYAWLESFLRSAGGVQDLGKRFVVAGEQTACRRSRKWRAAPCLCQIQCQRVGARCGCSGGVQNASVSGTRSTHPKQPRIAKSYYERAYGRGGADSFGTIQPCALRFRWRDNLADGFAARRGGK